MCNTNKSTQEPTYLPEIKNTEDDTFRILARPTFDEMTQLFKSIPEMYPYERIAFAKIYGWSWAEYASVCREKGLALRI